MKLIKEEYSIQYFDNWTETMGTIRSNNCVYVPDNEKIDKNDDWDVHNESNVRWKWSQVIDFPFEFQPHEIACPDCLAMIKQGNIELETLEEVINGND